ncbi:MAG TPA: sigma factor-like helix-turn-helix DNA-binding protein [Terriglobales bacterium]|nr:sigma factor-like helix-turn-helix DNA-binding protein [Terriglobales bacterium]
MSLNPAVAVNPSGPWNFETAVWPHVNSLVQSSLRFTQDCALSREVVRKTILRTRREFAQLRRGTDCRLWLFKIMLQNWFEIRSHVAPIMASTAVSNTSGSPRANGIPALVRGMPDVERIVLLLFAADGFCCQQIAEITGWSLDTVVSRLVRARHSLKLQIGVGTNFLTQAGYGLS